VTEWSHVNRADYTFQHESKENLFALRRETFDGPGGKIYLDKAAGQLGDGLAVAAHTAYHLGAIQHALKNLDDVRGK
jgi:hypothetical protein